MASNTEAKFKVGDRVRLLGGRVMAAKKGATATVTRAGASEELIYVRWDRNELDGFQMDGGYHHGSFELIAPATSAVRTVTRREIVPGVYGIVGIAANGDIRLVSSRDPEELRAAAKLFNELADVLDEQQKEAA